MIAPARLRRLEAWLGAFGARLERLHYARPGGATGAYRWVPAHPPRGRILLAHGAGNDALYPLVALCRTLVRAGWELFAFDLDGHGLESTAPYSHDGVRAAIAAARAAAARPGEALPHHLLGHSLGGALVLDALASGSAGEVRSAVVLSAPTSLRVGAAAAVGELLGFIRPATLTQREHYGAWGMLPAFGPFRRGAYPFRRGADDPGAFGYVRTVQALLRAMALEERAAQIETPVLLVYGLADRLVPVGQGRGLAARIPGARLLEAPGESHWSVPWSPSTIGAVAKWLEDHR